MKSFLLDTSALLALRDDEPGADRVANILQSSLEGRTRAMGCFLSLMEVYYRVWKDEGEQEGRLAYEQCLSLPMTWLHETPELLEHAASIKARHPLSLAGAWIAASAELEHAVLIHKDPEFQTLALLQEPLPLKRKYAATTKPKQFDGYTTVTHAYLTAALDRLHLYLKRYKKSTCIPSTFPTPAAT